MPALPDRHARPGYTKPVALIVAALLAGGLFTYLAFYARPNQKFTDDGDVVIAALDKYYSDTGAYPADLPGLTPAYLPALPTTPDSTPADWAYALNPIGRDFTLVFARPGVRGSTYSSVTRQWEADDK